MRQYGRLSYSDSLASCWYFYFAPVKRLALKIVFENDTWTQNSLPVPYCINSPTLLTFKSWLLLIWYVILYSLYYFTLLFYAPFVLFIHRMHQVAYYCVRIIEYLDGPSASNSPNLTDWLMTGTVNPIQIQLNVLLQMPQHNILTQHPRRQPPNHWPTDWLTDCSDWTAKRRQRRACFRRRARRITRFLAASLRVCRQRRCHRERRVLSTQRL